MQYVSRDGKNQEEISFSRSQIDSLIEEWIIGKNAERNRAIIRRKLFDGICYEPLADEFGLSVRQVKNIVRTCEIKIFTHMK